MTKNELDAVCKGTADTLIKADAMTDVAFGPLFYREEPDHYRVTGIRYSYFLEDFMGDSFGRPLREAINIKKGDLASWKQVTVKKD